jgi:hypothetical protein
MIFHMADLLFAWKRRQIDPLPDVADQITAEIVASK